MIRRRVHGFLRRRLSSEEYLGLHLTVGLLLCLALAVGFGVVARFVVGEPAVTAFDTNLGEQLAERREGEAAVRTAFRLTTRLGNVETLTTLTVLVALGLLVGRRRLLALVWLLAMIVTGLLNSALKEVFDRPRPPFPDAAIREQNASFPSGHAMGSTVAYGLLTYFGLRKVRQRGVRPLLVGAAATAIIAVGFSRVYLGAHYLSDVVGGFAVGGAWLSACVSALEVVRRRRLAAGEGAAKSASA